MKSRAEQIRFGNELLRQGRLREAARLLKEMPVRKLPEAQRLAVAKIAVRVGRVSLGLRLLAPLVERRSGRTAAQAELRAEYANQLAIAGCGLEAFELLDAEDLRLHPDALLAKAWRHFDRWEHELAVPLLESYVQRQPDPYFQEAGRVNLVEALFAQGKLAPALAQANKTISTLKSGGHRRLLANALHLRAQIYTGLGKFRRAEDDLRHAALHFGSARTLDALLVRRQRAFLRAEEESRVGPIQEFRTEARRANDGESVRECDFQILRLNPKRALFERLYFGSPYSAYRRRLERLTGWEPGPNYLWGDRRGPMLDLSAKAQELKITRQNQKLLGLLLRDFYLPPSAGELFSGLSPAENFDPLHSPARVHQALRRLRAWFVEAQVPLELVCRGRRYSLHRTGAIAVRIPLSGAVQPLELLRRHFGQSSFSLAQAQVVLACSRATAYRWIAGPIARGLVARSRDGKKAVYSLQPAGPDLVRI